MNIHTIRNNLQNTIKSKQALLQALKNQSDTIVKLTTVQFLEINIQELQVILADVETCCENN